jgi:hypothetical protein
MNYLKRQELATILAKDGQKKLIHVRPDADDPLVFKLFSGIPGMFYVTEFARPSGYVDPDTLPDEENPSYQGRILVDNKGHWIYDGNKFTAGEQEQLAGFIIREE